MFEAADTKFERGDQQTTNEQQPYTRKSEIAKIRNHNNHYSFRDLLFCFILESVPETGRIV